MLIIFTYILLLSNVSYSSVLTYYVQPYKKEKNSFTCNVFPYNRPVPEGGGGTGIRSVQGQAPGYSVMVAS